MVLVTLSEDDSLQSSVKFENEFITYLPDQISSMEIFGHAAAGENIDSLDGVDLECKVLIKMLRGLPRKLSLICICGEMPVIPDYLALVVIATRSTDKLVIRDNDAFDSDTVFGCLMSGFVLQDGPKALHLNFGTTISTSQANLLFEGIANSPCLETLNLESLRFEDPEAATDAFVEALEQNRSLNLLDLDEAEFEDLDEIFRAAILNAEVRSILMAPSPNVESRLDFGLALDVLSSEDCRLESLGLYYMEMVVGHWDDNPTKIITSVNEVNLVGVQIDNAHLFKGINKFKSMKELAFGRHNLDDLSNLDTLLIGNDVKLQSLSLKECRIDATYIIDFFRKLPRMACIRRIELRRIPFGDPHEWKNVLSNAVRHNTSLECIYFGEEVSVEYRVFFSILEVSFALNRAWRRFMENGTTAENNNAKAVAFPSNLWPLVLERATKISYFPCAGRGDAPSTLKIDTVFWLLRERMLTEIAVPR